jgi:hypothetical protein
VTKTKLGGNILAVAMQDGIMRAPPDTKSATMWRALTLQKDPMIGQCELRLGFFGESNAYVCCNLNRENYDRVIHL